MPRPRRLLTRNRIIGAALLLVLVVAMALNTKFLTPGQLAAAGPKQFDAKETAVGLFAKAKTQLPGQAEELKDVLPAIQANPKAAAARFKAVSPAEGSYVFPVTTHATVTAATPAALQVKVAGLSAETPLLIPLTTAVNGSVLRDAMGFKFADAPDQTRYQYVGDELKKLIQAQVKSTVKNPAALTGKHISVLGVVSVLDLGSPPPKAKPVNIQPVSVTVTP